MSARDEDGWPSLAVVVPVFDEASGIDESCRSIAEVVRRYPGRAQLIVVDDGSADDSAAIVERLVSEIDVLVLERHADNAGYGAALRTGARRAQELGYEYVGFMDSDLTNPPEDLLAIGRLAAAGHTYIKASRFAPGGSMAGVPPRRARVSRLGNLVGSLLFGAGISDVTNGFRAVRTDVYSRWELREPGFPVIVEELDLALRSGARPVEFPTVLTARTGEQRPSAFPYSASVFLRYLRYPLRALVRRILGRVRLRKKP